MGPSEVEQLLEEPFRAFRATLASGDQIIVTGDDEPFVTGLSLILKGAREAGRITDGSRLVSIPNIVLIEPLSSRPNQRRRRK